jgi:hypothetical protein
MKLCCVTITGKQKENKRLVQILRVLCFMLSSGPKQENQTLDILWYSLHLPSAFYPQKQMNN